MGQNIGIADVKVVLLDRSPFSGQQKQEIDYYFNPDNFSGMTDRENVYAVPDPINGIRLKEYFAAHDNFLVDIEGKPLEDSLFQQEVTVTKKEGEGTETVVSQVEFDATATARAKELGLVASENADGEKTEPKIDKDEKAFFTWQLTENIFVTGDGNPPPRKFSEPPKFDNSPEWTYVARPRPGGESNFVVLTPFMKKNPPDSASPVHWGCVTSSGSGSGGIAMNQPFEIIYYFCLRDPAIAKDAPPMRPRYKFMEISKKEIDLELSGSVYLAIEFGVGSAKDNYMLLFRNDLEPFFFQIRGSGKNKEAILLARFDGFNASRLFDPNHKFFTVSVEPVVGSLIIRSNVFSDTPWIIRAPITSPYFVGNGPIALFGGNVQAGFALRPIQYNQTGKFSTPETTFNFANRAGREEVICTTALKGAGEIEQGRSYDTFGTAAIHMVDAEKVDGNDVNSVIEYYSKRATESQSLNRMVDLKSVEVTEGSSQNLSTRTFKTVVSLTAGNMKQPSGYVVENGRSPYVFMVRCEVPASEGEPETESTDISCDVMSIDLNWNATSYNEIKHTGTIRLLNYRSGMENHTGTDYRSLTNRSVYLRIYAGWANGVGKPLSKPIFTGQTLKAEVTTRAEREIVTFQIEDYMAALQGIKFILCPFYDGMKASLAIRDMILQTGLADSRILTNNTSISSANLARDYGLPFCNPFEQPLFRFKDGTSVLEGVLKIAKMDWKAVYFDSYGNFHYDDIPGGIFNNANFSTKANFWSVGGGAPENQAWNLTSFSRLIGDTYNVFQVLGVEKRLLARLSGATAYKAGIYSPGAEGYLGYRKHLLIQEPALGNFDALMRYLDNYRRRLAIPPLTGKFEIYGNPELNPLSIITLDGQLLRIMSISTHIDRGENTYYQNIEGEWMFAAGAGKDEAPQLSESNSGADVGTAGTAGHRSTL